MGITRRNFLKATGVFTAAATLGINLKPAKARAEELKITKARETKTICPYCAVGCGMLVHSIPHTNKVSRLPCLLRGVAGEEGHLPILW